jgi:hypothetical protein
LSSETWLPCRSIGVDRRVDQVFQDRRLRSKVTIMRDLSPIHPGEQLREEFMKPLHTAACRLRGR